MISIRTQTHGPVKAFRFVRKVAGRFPAVPVHSYLVDGLLIDTAMPRAEPHLAALWKSEPIKQAILTHYHEDHSGNAAWLQRERKIPVYGSPLTVELVAKGAPVFFYQRFAFGRPKPANLLPIEQVIETNQYRFELLPTPGHSEDHLVLYEPTEGWLFSGDLFVAERVRLFKRGENIWQQMESLEKVLQKDFEWVFCAHYPPLRDGRAALERKLDFFRSFTQEALHYQRKGYGYAQIVKAMGLRERWVWRLFSGGDVSLRNFMQSVLGKM